MCNPVAMAAIMVVGSYEKGKADEDALNAKSEAATSEAEAAEFNVEQLGLDVEDIRAGTATAVKAHEINTAKIRGTQVALLGASGAEVSTGAALAIVEETARLSETDAMLIRYNASKDIEGIKGQQAEYYRQAGNFYKEAGSYKAAANQAVARSLLSGGTQSGAMYAYGGK